LRGNLQFSGQIRDASAQRFLPADAFFKFREGVSGDSPHGTLQFTGKQTQKLKVFFNLAVPVLEAVHTHL
jgi:hypothetical protein